MPLQWDDYKGEFDWDGSWRDIYVLDTSIDDWQLLLDFLSSSDYGLAYLASSEVSALPGRANDIFAQRPLGAHLSVLIDQSVLNCHFFHDEEIEFDLDPRQIGCAAQANLIFVFMEQVARILKKPVILTPENLKEVPIFRFDPIISQIEYLPPQ